MANSYKRTQWVLNAVVAEMFNMSTFINSLYRQVSKEFVSKKVSTEVKVKRPTRYKPNDGLDITANKKDIQEATFPITIDQFKNIAFELPGEERLLSISDEQLREDHVLPAASALAESIEMAAPSHYYNFYHSYGVPGPSTQLEVKQALNKMKFSSVPMNDNNLFGVYDPDAASYLSDQLRGSFLKDKARTAIEKSKIGMIGHAEISESNSLFSHLNGLHGGAALVNGAAQNVAYDAVKDTWSQTIVLDGFTASQVNAVRQGDVFTLPGVFTVQYGTYQTKQNLQEFTALANADSDGSGNVTVEISPPIITSGDYQTVSAAPADNAPLTWKGAADTLYPQNLLFHRNSMALVTAPLEDLPGQVVNSVTHRGITVKYTRGSNIETYETIARLDLAFGLKVITPEFGVRHWG